MKKIGLILFVVFLSAGCAGTKHMAKSDKVLDPTFQPDKATLVIVRELWMGGNIVYYHYLDGKLIGETMGQTYFITPVTPGPHYVVVATKNTAVAHFDFKPGKTYFLREGVLPWDALTSGFYPMTPEEAGKTMKGCSYLEYDNQTGEENMDPKLYEQAIDEYLKDAKGNPNPEVFKDILNYDGVSNEMAMQAFR